MVRFYAERTADPVNNRDFVGEGRPMSKALRDERAYRD
jgi:hypothetical protein